MSTPLTLRQPSDTLEAARFVLQGHRDARVFAFHGELGAGKTTLIKALCAELGVAAGTSSPSFAIVNEYRTASGEPVYHFDLYRLRNAEELEGIGFVEYVDSGSYCFVEWPELAEHLLPPDTVHLRIRIGDDGTRFLEPLP
ncbi:MAG TPA: tRNA (adenosine(37)-N6)-threonylcarbamoyltransferase complex ATPase subunit type 1 TsaE [Flavobacteriales bacterium]